VSAEADREPAEIKREPPDWEPIAGSRKSAAEGLNKGFGKHGSGR